MTGIAAVLELVDAHWYDAAAAGLDRLVPQLGAPADLVHAAALARLARRALDLDAEDFAQLAVRFDSPWAPTLSAAAFPAGPREEDRGALGSMIGLFRLMLEVIDLRAARDEPLQVVLTAHLIGEYLPQLAWEKVLGHGGDPLRLTEQVRDSRWGSDDPDCPHPVNLRSTAHRTLHACEGDLAGYTAYLDRFHSRQGHALAVCAMNHETTGIGERPDVGPSCPNPCAFATRGSLEERRSLDARVRLALIYLESPLVALRHHAPAGHFFGVPSAAEISTAWLETWSRLTKVWPDGANPLLDPDRVVSIPADEALPGLSSMVSAVAGLPVTPGRLIGEIAAELRQVLTDYERRQAEPMDIADLPARSEPGERTFGEAAVHG